MRIKKTFLKIALLVLILLFLFIHYRFINPHKKPKPRLTKPSSSVKTDASDKSNWAADFLNSDEISINFVKDPIVNENNYKFIHTSEQVCLNKPVDILVAVQSFVINFDRRRSVRQTLNARLPIRIVHVFFMGKSGNLDGLQNRLGYEANRYGDIVQADIDETVGNLSLLSTSMLKWVSIYCPNASFVVKKIDEGWVDFTLMFQALRQKEIDYRYFVMGNTILVKQSQIEHVIHYYYQSISEYRDSPCVMFAREPVYGFSGRTALVLHQASLRTRYFWKEDVFITGMSAYRARIPIFFDYSFVYG